MSYQNSMRSFTLVSDPSSPFPLSSVPLLPSASATPGLIAGVGGMSLPLGMGEVSLAQMKKRGFVTPTQTVASVAREAVTDVFHGNAA